MVPTPSDTLLLVSFNINTTKRHYEEQRWKVTATEGWITLWFGGFVPCCLMREGRHTERPLFRYVFVYVSGRENVALFVTWGRAGGWRRNASVIWSCDDLRGWWRVVYYMIQCDVVMSGGSGVLRCAVRMCGAVWCGSDVVTCLCDVIVLRCVQMYHECLIWSDTTCSGREWNAHGIE